MPGSYPTPKSASVTKPAKSFPKPEEDPEPKKKGRVESTVHRGEVDSASDLAARLTGGYSGSNLDINRSFLFQSAKFITSNMTPAMTFCYLRTIRS